MKEYLIIEVNNKKIAIELEAVLEINRISSIHDVPHYGKGYIGMLSVRNETIPVYDLSSIIFGIKTNVVSTTKIITISAKETIALVCDDVVGTMENQISEKKEGVFQGQLLNGNTLVPVLDLNFLWEMIMSEKEIKSPEVCYVGTKNTSELINRAEESAEIKEEEQKQSYLICRAGNELFAIPVDLIRETIKVDKITQVPGLPDYLSGIFSVRGEILPVIDLKMIFLMEGTENKTLSDIVVIEYDSSKFGLKVESVEELVAKGASELKSPQHLGNLFSSFITGQFEYENSLVSILDLNSLVEKIKSEQGGNYELVQKN